MNNYSKELIELLQLDIPYAIESEDGFLEIAGIAHLENVNSRIYAFFLDGSKYPDLAALFIESLLEIVADKRGDRMDMYEYEVITEYSTQKRNRIDIVLRDTDNKKAVLIENKIYHHLDNDFLDYWGCLGYDSNNQVGILLTLTKTKVPDEVVGKFINITHIEWIQRIQKKGLPSGLPSNIYTYLNDFMRTMEDLTNTSAMSEQAKFFFENTEKVQLARQVYSEGVNFINSQLGILASLLEWDLYGRGDDWRNIWDKQNKLHTYYTIWSGDLLKGSRTITIIIELNSNDFDKIPSLDKLLEDDKQFAGLEKDGLSNSSIRHYAFKVYHLTVEDINDLANFLFEKIELDFAGLMRKILAHNYPNRDIDYLEEKQK